MIRQVEIESFRSIRRLAFEPGVLCALVGANNAGKSNILAAINLVLGRVTRRRGRSPRTTAT